jgi:large subunit ribosomal protein L3
VGLVKDAFTDKPFDSAWLKKPNNYFSSHREIKVSELTQDFTVGKDIDYTASIKAGDIVNVTGLSKGRGFAGVVKRYGFAGGRASHGPRLGRLPGSVGFMRSQGRVIKGKRLPGHFGTTQHTLEMLPIVSFEPEARMIMVKGGVPGGKGSLLYLHKA